MYPPDICGTPNTKTEERPDFCGRQSIREQQHQQQGSSPLVGRDVSRFDYEFQAQGVLGSGGFGTVYKCRKRLDGCLYAVKVTNQRFRGELDKEHVLKEVYALAALCNSDDNPHIVRYFSAWVEDARLYIQTELCDMSLADLLKERNEAGAPGIAGKNMIKQINQPINQPLHQYTNANQIQRIYTCLHMVPLHVCERPLCTFVYFCCCRCQVCLVVLGNWQV
jgi:serine/threonine protein kinase